MKRSVLATMAGFLLTTLSWAQEPTVLCATDIMRARAIAEDPTYLQREAEFLEELEMLMQNSAVDRDGEVVYVVPVVFHILHLGGKENISNEQVLDAMSILNRDYDRRNADTAGVHPAYLDNIADMDIEFRLATRDPNGLCTNGIIRHRTAETLRGESTSKVSPWPRDKYMNIWVVDRILSGAAGYFSGGPPNWLDGIVILHDYTGSVGTGQSFRSRALTHEVGHYLSLAHVWGSNNGVPDENTPTWAMQAVCGDDGVEDTPFTRGWSSCPPATNNERSWADCERTPFPDGTAYLFSSVTTSSGTVDPSTTPDVARPDDDNVLMVDMGPMSAVGVSANSAVDGAFGFTDWGTGAPNGATAVTELTGAFDASKYYSFTATPQPMVDRQSGISSFSFEMKRDTMGVRSFCVRGSINNYSANLPVTTGPGLTVLSNNSVFVNADIAGTYRVTVDPPNGAAGNPPQAAGYSPFQQPNTAQQANPVTFRIYAWNAEDPAGMFLVDSVVINGYSGVVENVENYMEYSYCSKMFTNGQRARARAALLSTTTQRASLWTEENLAATGTAEGAELHCAPGADFYVQVGTDPTSPAIPYGPFSCVNTSVRFFDNSAFSFPTGWSWTFQDGVPATSTQQNPTVQFTSTGWKTVTLTASNDYGSSTKTDQYAVFIGGPGASIAPTYESFESQTGEDLYPYMSLNHENNHTSFKRFTGGGATGNACAWLNSGSRNQLDFIDGDNVGDYDDLITPLFNLSGAPSATLSFRYAYSTNTSTAADITEKLIIDSSTDCGRTWLNRSEINGTTLVTNGTSAAVPPQNWTLKSITLPGSVLSDNVRFRFRFISSEYSNNLYIDDLWIGVPVGIQELGTEGFISLYPNPTNDHFFVQVAGMESSATEIVITDMRGAVVYRQTFQPQGGAGIEISGHGIGLAEGMYLLRAQNALGSSAQKLVMGR